MITQVSGTSANVEGMGIVPVTFGDSDVIYLLYPCYHMPQNPQNTLGLAPLKKYNQVRSARVESLSWLRIVHKDGRKTQIATIPKYHTSELQDYVTVNIGIPTLPDISPKTLLPDPKITKASVKNLSTFCETKYRYATKMLVSLHRPQVLKSFSKHDYTDWSILHRRLDHIHDDKLAKMCKDQLLKGLPKKFPKNLHNHRRDCWICPRGALHNDPHGITLNTDHLRMGQLLHMDFYFMNKESIRGFTSVLNTCDAKCRKLWQFCTPSKRPPITTVRFFLQQLIRMGRPCSHIRTDMGGELAGSAEF